MEKQKAVIAIINYKGYILLGKKRADSTKALAGKWHIPGEKLEDNETPEQALTRGVREETGLEIRIGNYLGTSKTPTGRDVHWYECFAQTDNAIPGSDLEAVKWVQKAQVLSFCEERTDSWPENVKNYFR